MEPLKRADSIRMIYSRCKDIDNFSIMYPDERKLNEHQIFDELHFTPMLISKICMLIQNGETLDKIYINQKDQIKNHGNEG